MHVKGKRLLLKLSDVSSRDVEVIQRYQAMQEPILERDEEDHLIEVWQKKPDSREGRKAWDRLILCHQKLLISMARKFEKSGASFADLYQEGSIGLMVAADKFEMNKGNRFNTFAQWHVFSHMQDYAQRSTNSVRIGKGRKEKAAFRLIMQARSRQGGSLTQAHYEAIAFACEMDCRDVESIAEAAGSRGVSLNQSVGKDDETTEIGDRLVEPNYNAFIADRTVMQEKVSVILQEALDLLTARERKIIIERFLNEDGKTLKDLAEDMDISAERVRQIGRDAIIRLHEILLQNGLSHEDLMFNEF